MVKKQCDRVKEKVNEWRNLKEAKDFYDVKNQRLFPLIISTNKLKDVYRSKEALLSFVLSLMFTIFITLVVNYSIENISERLLDLLGIQIGTLLGLLGFLIGGAALVTGSISIDMMKKIDLNKQFHQLLALLVPFYILGVIIGVSFLLSLFIYLVVLTSYPFNGYLVFILSFLNFFSFYTV